MLHVVAIHCKLEKQLCIKHRSKRIYLGQEFIFTERKGWRLSRYGSIKILKRFWTIVESGVYNKLLNISYKPPIANVYKPRRLTIFGNIFVQFVFHSFGLLLAFLVLVAELHKHIIFCLNSVRLTVGFLIGNFFHQSKKAFTHARVEVCFHCEEQITVSEIGSHV